MSLFEFAPQGPSGAGARPPSVRPHPVQEAHPALDRLRACSRQLRRRLLAVNASVGLAVFLLAQALGGATATAVAGPYTLGMLLLSLQGATTLVSTVWFARTSAAECDGALDRLLGAGYGHAPGGRVGP